MPGHRVIRAGGSNSRRGGWDRGAIRWSGCWTGRKMASFWSNLAEENKQLPMRPARRYLALYLPRWATDCLKRADPQLAALTRPFALWEKQQGAMRLVAVDARASAEGLFGGQNLS